MLDRPALHQQLDRYTDALRALDSRWTGDFQPPRSESWVRKILEDFVPKPPEELVDLWTWRDGQNPLTQQTLFRGYFFRPLDRETISTFRYYANNHREIVVAEGLYWPQVEDAIPVFFSAGGHWVFVDAGDGPDRGYVFAGDSGDLVPALRICYSLTKAVGIAHHLLGRRIWTLGRDLTIGDERYDLPPP